MGSMTMAGGGINGPGGGVSVGGGGSNSGYSMARANTPTLHPSNPSNAQPPPMNPMNGMNNMMNNMMNTMGGGGSMMNMNMNGMGPAMNKCMGMPVSPRLIFILRFLLVFYCTFFDILSFLFVYVILHIVNGKPKENLRDALIFQLYSCLLIQYTYPYRACLLIL